MPRFSLVFTFVFIASVYVLAEDEHKCGNNEESNICGGMCEPGCDCRHHNPIFCPGIQCGGITTGCRCKEGFLRNSHECVAPEDCPKKVKRNSDGLKFCLDED